MSDAILRFVNVSHDYPTPTGMRRVLDNVVFDIHPGQIVSVCGLSGCGKSTLARLAVGLEEPTEGNVLFRGRSLGGHPARGAALVFQEYRASLFPWMTTRQNVALGLYASETQVLPEDALARVDDVLSKTKLAECADFLVSRLSGGMCQRVALARALVATPALLVLDEALASLDFLIRQELRRELRDLAAAEGTAVLFVTHQIDDAIELGSRVVVVTDYVNVNNAHILEIPRHPAIGGVEPAEEIELRNTIASWMRADLVRRLTVEHTCEEGA